MSGFLRMRQTGLWCSQQFLGVLLLSVRERISYACTSMDCCGSSVVQVRLRFIKTMRGPRLTVTSGRRQQPLRLQPDGLACAVVYTTTRCGSSEGLRKP